MQIDALLFPPRECRGFQNDPFACVCLQTDASGILSNGSRGISKVTISGDVESYPIEAGILSPSYAVFCERGDIKTLRELIPGLTDFFVSQFGERNFELNYGVFPFGIRGPSRSVSTTHRITDKDIHFGPFTAHLLEKITGWFPCIPAANDTSNYTPEVMRKLRRNRTGTGTHFIIMENEQKFSEN